MVQTSTYYLVILTFLIGIALFNLYFTKHKPTYGYGRLILICIVVEFLLVSLVVIIPAALKVLIYGSVLMGTYVSIYYRYKQKIGGEF